jgi:plastocyanin
MMMNQKTDRDRAAFSRMMIAAAIVIVLVVAGIGIYAASVLLGPSDSTTTSATSTGDTSNSSTTIQSTSAGSVEVGLSPSAALVAPGQIQNFSVIQLSTVGAALSGMLSMKAYSPTGISVVLQNTSVPLAGNPQDIPFSVKAASTLSPGKYDFVLETSSATSAPKNQTFTIEVVPALVIIQDFAFHPENLTVPVGTPVTWINLDSTLGCCDPGNHNVAFLSGSTTVSPTLARLDNWTYTFGTVGVFTYECSIHPWMRGQVNATG